MKHLLLTLVSLIASILLSKGIKSEQVGPPVEKLKIEIELRDSIVHHGDRVMLKIKLTNVGSESQKILFDKPQTGTGGLWYTSAHVIDQETRVSALKYVNKSVLSSQVYSEEMLERNYYSLKPGESIEGEYALDDIVVYKSKDNRLDKGVYEIQLFYKLNASNILRLTVN